MLGLRDHNAVHSPHSEVERYCWLGPSDRNGLAGSGFRLRAQSRDKHSRPERRRTGNPEQGPHDEHRREKLPGPCVDLSSHYVGIHQVLELVNDDQE